MPSQEDIDAQQALLEIYRRNLSHLLRQSAKYGSEAAAPLPLSNDIREARESIRHIKTILQNWGVHVEELPGDEEMLRGIPLHEVSSTNTNVLQHRLWLIVIAVLIPVLAVIITKYILDINGANISLAPSASNTAIALPKNSPSVVLQTSVSNIPASIVSTDVQQTHIPLPGTPYQDAFIELITAEPDPQIPVEVGRDISYSYTIRYFIPQYDWKKAGYEIHIRLERVLGREFSDGLSTYTINEFEPTIGKPITTDITGRFIIPDNVSPWYLRIIIIYTDDRFHIGGTISGNHVLNINYQIVSSGNPTMTVRENGLCSKNPINPDNESVELLSTKWYRIEDFDNSLSPPVHRFFVQQGPRTVSANEIRGQRAWECINEFAARTKAIEAAKGFKAEKKEEGLAVLVYGPDGTEEK